MPHPTLHDPPAPGTPATPTRGHVIHWARFYDPVVSLITLGRQGTLRRKTVDLAELQPGMAVLEVGCGTGDVALEAGRRVGPGGAVHGVDPAPAMIAVANGKSARAGLPVGFQVGVIEALAFPDATFDVVFSSLMMHHLPGDLQRRGLAECARVLKPGGRCVVVDLQRPTSGRSRALATATLHGGLRHGVQDLPEQMTAAGFTQVETGHLGFAVFGYAIGRV